MVKMTNFTLYVFHHNENITTTTTTTKTCRQCKVAGDQVGKVEEFFHFVRIECFLQEAGGKRKGVAKFAFKEWL